MKICSLNANGIRAAWKKGLPDWMNAEQPGLICLQEIRIQDHQLTKAQRNPPGYHGYFHFAQKPGYSGVAIYSKQKPEQVKVGIGWDVMDQEGRFLQLDFPRFSVVSIYLPSGTSSEERQAIKYEMMDYFYDWMKSQLASGREMIICGDWNIAHREIDLKNYKSNQKNSGFLPEERAWMSKVFDELGYVDVFRTLNPDPDQYTWWSNRGRAWEKNVGWRIDYHIATPNIASTANAESVYKTERFSDHAPLTIEYRLNES